VELLLDELVYTPLEGDDDELTLDGLVLEEDV
jgi:hypothetical protein